MPGVEWHRSANERLVVDIQLVPLSDARSRLLGTAIMFNDVSRFRQLREELESTNRQLETAYEELQTTNEELRERTTQISSLNSFMESILGSLGAAVIVVNRGWSCRSGTGRPRTSGGCASTKRWVNIS